MHFPRKEEMKDYWKTEAREGRKKTLRHRKVAFNQGNLHPLPACSEEMRISLKIRKLRNQLHFSR